MEKIFSRKRHLLEHLLYGRFYFCYLKYDWIFTPQFGFGGTKYNRNFVANAPQIFEHDTD